MEADSQISGSKTLENKSLLSFNYIYKKIIIKESFNNSKKELRQLNYEKIAKYKMKNLNIKYFLEFIIKLKNTLNENNPFLKYIKDVQPYDYTNIKINISQTEPLLNQYYINKKIIKNSKKKEKILNFSDIKKNMKNIYFSRMYNIEYKKVNHNRNEKIILIQKHIRGFLMKKIVDEEVNKIIAKKIINKILIIQRETRKFLNKKNSLGKLIINIIKNERISKSNKITDIFSLYHYRNFYKKNLIIRKILKARNDSILLIQNKFRTYKFIRKVKEVLKKEKKSYVLTYPFNAKTVSIKIFINNSCILYNYEICPVRKYFVLYLDKNLINSGEYLCHMIVNNNIILDKRYKSIIGKNNIFYNLIYIGDPPEVKYTKKEKIKIKESKKEKSITRNKNKKEENTVNYFINSYNDASYSTNSYSIKSDHEKNKFMPIFDKNKNKKKEENILNKLYNDKINDFLKSNIKKEKRKHIYNPLRKYFNFININTGNINKKRICIKHGDFDINFKNIIKSNEPMEYKISFDTQSSKKEGSIQSQQIKYNNILDELSQSISSTKSNLSVKNINSFTKKTHRARFSSNDSAKLLSSKKVNSNILDNSNSITINTTISSTKNKNYK